MIPNVYPLLSVTLSMTIRYAKKKDATNDRFPDNSLGLKTYIFSLVVYSDC